MKIDPDDPILTSYALCELDEVSFAAVENALKESPEAKARVDEILRARSLVAEQLAAEPMPTLTPEQRAAIQAAAIEAAARSSRPTPVILWTRIAWWSGLAAAACLILGMILPALLPRLSTAKAKAQVVRRQSTPPLPQPAPAKPDQPRLLAKAEPETVRRMERERLVQAEPPPQPAGSPAPSSNASAVFRMDPRLLARYGLLRPENSVTSSAGPAGRAQSPSGELVRRYGRTQQSGNDSEVLREEFADNYSRYKLQPESVPTGPGTASYPRYAENTFQETLEQPLSTFSIDVDTASYANVRRFLNQGQLPPPDAVRIEEMVNAFHYDYPQARGNEPFSVGFESAPCPWAPEHRLVRVALQTRTLPSQKRPAANLVFLVDISGSMQPAERLPLLKQALRALAKKMNESDRIAIVVYATSSRIALPSTSCEEKEKILDAIDRLNAGGTTNGGAGIQQAYALATENFIRGGINRVILCTDGDFNVGITNQQQLIQLIREQARSGVFLTALGVGTDNYKDALMQRLADNGNGNYHYLDSFEEAQKVLIDQMNGTLMTVAKDVKLQVEFNPAVVRSWRLVGYEKRLLRTRDFNNDRKDAGDAGAGHSVTAFYEIVPAAADPVTATGELKYQPAPRRRPLSAPANPEMLTLKLRFKEPAGQASELREWSFTDPGRGLDQASPDYQFAAAVASFGMLLKGSPMAGDSSYASVLDLARSGKGPDPDGARAEFMTLVHRASQLSGARDLRRAPAGSFE